MSIKYFLKKLTEKKNLTKKESEFLLMEIMKGKINPVQTSSVLTALKIKGETTEEIIGFIKAMRKNMLKVKAENAIDVCGTGGDGKGTFNISTAVAFVVAGCGVKIAKHGNKAISSKSGSADVLQELGLKIDLTPKQAENILQKTGMVFLFAPLYHKSFNNVATVRKELGITTIFNYLGPFTNPAEVKRQIIGVPNLEIAEKLADVAKQLNYKHLMIVTSQDGMDELSLFSKTFIFEIENNLIKKKLIDPEELGFKKYSQEEITGAGPKENAEIIMNILNGQKNAKRDIIVLNSIFALLIAGKVKNIPDAMALAEKSIDQGSAKNILQNLIKETQKYA